MMRALGAVLSLLLAGAARAHVVDQYQESAQLRLSSSGVAVTLRLTPGSEVAERVVAMMDRDGDGVVSAGEQAHYAARVASEVSLFVDDRRVPLVLGGQDFPPAQTWRAGTGTIVLELGGKAPLGGWGTHRLRFENHHAPELGSYLVNVLLPLPDRTELRHQSRDAWQQRLELTLWVAPLWWAQGLAWLFLGVVATGLAALPRRWHRMAAARTRGS